MLSKNIFNGFFDISSGSIQHHINGVFDAVSTVIQPNIFLNIGNNNVIENELEYEQYRPQPTVGQICENINGVKTPISNVRVSFIKDYTVNEKEFNEYNGDVVIADYCMTDKDGYYCVFVKPDTYMIRIDGRSGKQELCGQKIINGLNNEFYFLIKSLISKKYKDVIEYSGTDYKLITGNIVNQIDTKMSGSEIIISQGRKIISYVVADKYGKYSFALQNGIYDVRIRHENESIKILNNFNWVSGKGFVDALQEQSVLFKTDEKMLVQKV